MEKWCKLFIVIVDANNKIIDLINAINKEALSIYLFFNYYINKLKFKHIL